jgi:hypothetical protein
MTPADALAALRNAYAAGTAHPVPTLRAWGRLAGVDVDARVCLRTGDATVTGIREKGDGKR